METERVLAIAERYLPHEVENNGHGGAHPQKNGLPRRESLNGNSAVEHPLDLDSLHQAAYEVGYARGHEAGFRTGYREGFRDGEQRAEGTRDQAIPSSKNHSTETPAGSKAAGSEGVPGPRLLGLPCAKCGAFFFSDEAHCPRCKTARKAETGGQRPGTREQG